MSKQARQLNVNSSSRDLRSDFVVDLRQAAVREIKQIETIEKKIEKEASVEIKRLEKKARSLKPDLLKIGREIKREKKRMLFSSQFSLRTSRSQRLWIRFYNQKISDFKRAVRLNMKQARRHAGKGDDYVPEKEENNMRRYRSALSFAIALILIIVPIKLLSYFEFLDLDKLENKILNQSQLAVNSLMAAGDAVTNMDFKAADSEFQNAGNNFLAAQEELNKISDSILSLAAFSGDPKLKLAAESKKFLRAGAIASSLGSNLVLASDSLFGQKQENFTAALDQFTFYGEAAVSDAKSLEKELSKVDPENLPLEYQSKFESIQKQSALLSDNLEAFVGAGAKLKSVLGTARDKRYLLVFQNNSELRASGGFLGSYALVDVSGGRIKNLEVPGGGSYDTEGGMSVRVAAPRPLWLVNPLWHFWDANWWPNWPTTAKNLMWFYEKSDGPTVDGVISVTPTVVERLLEITGPIDLTKEYGIVIDANNFWDTVQKIVEQKNIALTNPGALAGIPATSTQVQSSLPIKQGLDVNSENKPKKIIGDLMAKILEILPQKLNKDNLVKILALFEESMSEKQILFYFNDPSLQAEASRRNWAGEIKDSSRDYLMVVNTNIAGQKSDRMMSEKIEHSSELSADGTIVDTLIITRTHNGSKGEAMTGVRNVDWLRIYVPQGSELLSADGFRAPEDKYLQEKPEPEWMESKFLESENRALIEEESGTKIYNEEGKTVFANWLMIDPGESGVVTIRYRLPFNLLDQPPKTDWLERINSFLNPDEKKPIPYSLMLQKQPGAKASDFSSRLRLPQEWSVFWRYPEDLKGDSGWDISAKLDADKYWSILIENNK